jgi:hypothetical protein
MLVRTECMRGSPRSRGSHIDARCYISILDSVGDPYGFFLAVFLRSWSGPLRKVVFVYKLASVGSVFSESTTVTGA